MYAKTACHLKFAPVVLGLVLGVGIILYEEGVLFRIAGSQYRVQGFQIVTL